MTMRSNGHHVPNVRSKEATPRLFKRMSNPKKINKKAKKKWFFGVSLISKPSFLVCY
jgi:hypothetical protein